jgi:hypothetical protein
MCTVLLPPAVNPTAVNKYTNFINMINPTPVTADKVPPTTGKISIKRMQMQPYTHQSITSVMRGERYHHEVDTLYCPACIRFATNNQSEMCKSAINYCYPGSNWCRKKSGSVLNNDDTRQRVVVRKTQRK